MAAAVSDFATPTLAQRSLSALVWSYAGAGARAITQLVIQVLLARQLGPEAFGQATAALFVLGLGWLFAEGGVGAALVQRPQVSEADISFALGWLLSLSLLTGGLVVLAAKPLAELLGNGTLAPLILACGLLIPLQALSNLPSSLMRRQFDMKRLQLIHLGGYMVGYGVVGLWMASAGWGAWSLVAAFGAHSLLSFIGSYACVRHTLRPRLRGDAALRGFGVAVVGTNLANWAIENLDRLVVNRYWGATALGEFTAASNLSRAPANLLMASAQSVTLAAASRVQDEPQRVIRGYLAVSALVWLVSAPTFVWLALNAEAVVHLLYGERWQQAGPLFAAFCVGLPFYALLSVTGPTLWAVGAVHSELKSQIVIAACTLAGFLALIGTPLRWVVWLVPALGLLRLLLVYRSLARRIELGTARSLAALTGGSLLASLTALAWALTAATSLQGVLAAAVSGLLTLTLSVIALQLLPRVVVPLELRCAMQARARQSRGMRHVCSWMGIAERQP